MECFICLLPDRSNNSCIPIKQFAKCAFILKPSSFTRFHQALVRCNYRWLYSSGKRACPGPKGPSKEVVAAVVEMKGRNPRFGCRKIAEQIAQAFGIEIDKDTVRRILAKALSGRVRWRVAFPG